MLSSALCSSHCWQLILSPWMLHLHQLPLGRYKLICLNMNKKLLRIRYKKQVEVISPQIYALDTVLEQTELSDLLANGHWSPHVKCKGNYNSQLTCRNDKKSGNDCDKDKRSHGWSWHLNRARTACWCLIWTSESLLCTELSHAARRGGKSYALHNICILWCWWHSRWRMASEQMWHFGCTTCIQWQTWHSLMSFAHNMCENLSHKAACSVCVRHQFPAFCTVDLNAEHVLRVRRPWVRIPVHCTVLGISNVAQRYNTVVQLAPGYVYMSECNSTQSDQSNSV